jgi:DNA-binding transcriptional ArsR family regulator
MPKSEQAATNRRAAVFAALGDPTRLSFVARLSDGRARSISRLTKGTALSRQAVTKHLRMLESAGLVESIRVGRESRFRYRPERVDDARTYLDGVSSQWNEALSRLRDFVEK